MLFRSRSPQLPLCCTGGGWNLRDVTGLTQSPCDTKTRADSQSRNSRDFSSVLSGSLINMALNDGAMMIPRFFFFPFSFFGGG